MGIVYLAGKTLIAKAVANQTSATFLRVVGSELIQKYLVSFSLTCVLIVLMTDLLCIQFTHINHSILLGGWP